MSYRIAVSFAAAAIAISCIDTDASARGGGGGSGHVGSHQTPAVPAGNLSGAPGTIGSGGAGARAPNYAPGSYNSACGYYPYPPCKKVPAR